MLSLPETPWRKIALEELGGEMYRVNVLEIGHDEQFFEVVKVVAATLAGAGRVVESNAATRSVLVTTTDYAAFLKNLVFEGVGLDE